MDKYSIKLDELLVKAGQVRQQNQRLKDEIERVHSANSELKDQLQIERNTVAELNNKIKMLKLARIVSSENKEEATELKRKINQYIREIDKCVAMLIN